MWRGISLANKCVLLFGAAVVLIILAALSVSFLRVNAIVEEGQRELSRQLVAGWLQTVGEFGGGAVGQNDGTGDGERADPERRVKPGIAYPLDSGTANPGGGGAGERRQAGAGSIVVVLKDKIEEAAKTDPFVARAWKRLTESRGETVADGGPSSSDLEVHEAEWMSDGRRYRYARLHEVEIGSPPEPVASKGVASGKEKSFALIVLDRTARGAIEQALTNLAYLASAALISLGLAVLVFYLITTRLILSPVRALKETAAMVREGDTSIRADIRTGDEFEELGETFNQMLEAITASQQQLRAINASLDLKVNELAERNVALFESNKLKGDFLANVSHELRTPLNSIIGFAELLQEQVEKDAREIGAEGKATEPPPLAKRRRYLDNIVMAGRGLLEMINSLLDMAKLEAGRMELKVEAVNLPDLCEALIALIRPLADRGGVELTMEVAKDLPLIETDAKKLQQVVFNLLSNAVKFTSEMVSAGGGGAPAKVSLRAERLFGRASEGAGAEDRVRISVLDTGPGISAEDQEKIFQKFEQLDSGHTRRHAGTGLGLAICKELTSLLQGEIQVDSEVGRGSMFSVILPIRVDAQRAHEMKLEMAFRGSLSSQGASALPPGAVPRPTGRDAVTERA